LSRIEDCLLLFPSYLSGNDTKNNNKKDSLSQCRTPTPSELFTQAWPDFTREGKGRERLGMRPKDAALPGNKNYFLESFAQVN
jgi:hypothetical protein